MPFLQRNDYQIKWKKACQRFLGMVGGGGGGAQRCELLGKNKKVRQEYNNVNDNKLNNRDILTGSQRHIYSFQRGLASQKS